MFSRFAVESINSIKVWLIGVNALPIFFMSAFTTFKLKVGSLVGLITDRQLGEVCCRPLLPDASLLNCVLEREVLSGRGGGSGPQNLDLRCIGRYPLLSQIEVSIVHGEVNSSIQFIFEP